MSGVTSGSYTVITISGVAGHTESYEAGGWLIWPSCFAGTIFFNSFYISCATIKVRNIWELGELSKVQKFQSLARMLTSHLSVNSYGFSCTMPSD